MPVSLPLAKQERDRDQVLVQVGRDLDRHAWRSQLWPRTSA
jgi:hypothetical protein